MKKGIRAPEAIYIICSLTVTPFLVATQSPRDYNKGLYLTRNSNIPSLKYMHLLGSPYDPI